MGGEMNKWLDLLIDETKRTKLLLDRSKTYYEKLLPFQTWLREGNTPLVLYLLLFTKKKTYLLL